MKPWLHHRGQQSEEKDTWQLSSFSELYDWAEGKGGAVRTAVLQFICLVSAEHLCKILNLKRREQSLELPLVEGQGPAVPVAGCATTLSVQMFGHK